MEMSVSTHKNSLGSKRLMPRVDFALGFLLQTQKKLAEGRY